MPEVYDSLKNELIDHFTKLNAEYPSAKTHPKLFEAYKNAPAPAAKKPRKREPRKKPAPKDADTKPATAAGKSGRSKAFAAMDKNEDGKVTLEELDGWFKNRAENNPDKFTYKEGQAKGVLAKLDANKDLSLIHI